MGLCIFFPVVFLTNDLVFRIIIAAVCGVAAYEIAHCCGCHKKWFVSVIMILFSAAAPFLISIREELFFYLSVVLCFYSMTIVVLYDGRIRTNDVGACFMGVLFSSFSLSCIAIFREKYGLAFLLIFIAAWCSDIAAYFVGSRFGKHKLIPKISPKKTVEGAIGGVAADMIAFAVFAFVYNKCQGISGLSIPVFCLLGLAASVVSQIGDLVMSAFKRSYGVKDFGYIFPGHGGVLDRFDSTLTVAPILLAASYLLGLFTV